MSATPPHRLVLVALLGIPLFCFLLAAAAYRYAIGTTPIGRMGLSQQANPYPDNRPADRVPPQGIRGLAGYFGTG